MGWASVSVHGLTQLNVEITSVCDKATLCQFCGHQNPSLHPTLKRGEMSPELLERLSAELQPLGQALVVQFHRDGDPLACSDVRGALSRFKAHIRSLVTHGEQLAKKAQEIIGQCEAVTVSIFRADPDRDVQYQSVRRFLELKGDALPRVYLKIVGDLDEDELCAYRLLGVPFMRRRLHLPLGNSKYAGGLPAMPEHGLCLDLLHHPSIAWDGRVYLCNRLDTEDRGVIGNLHEETLEAIWNGTRRRDVIQHHLLGRRDLVPSCAGCLYYGVPTA